MLEGMGLEYDNAIENGFEVTPLIQTKWRNCWNELETSDFENEKVVLNPKIGEIEKPYEMAIALNKKIGGKEQRIVVLGDADCLSNSEMFIRRDGIQANNSAFQMAIYEWLSNNEYPVDVRKPDFKDDGFKVDLLTFNTWRIILIWLIPIGILLGYFLIWFRRRKK